MQRKRLVWKLRESELVFAEQTLVAGLVPVIPALAPDGQLYDDAKRAAARALLLEEQGAAFIVLGAEILAPGKQMLTAEEQIRRIMPVLKKLRGKIGIPVAVVTTRAETAQRVLEAGAEIIFDPSAASFEPHIAKVVADASGVLILGHMRGTPERWAKQAPTSDPIANVLSDLDAGIHRARMAHLRNDQLAVEPGFNMGKRRDENVAVAARVFLLNRFEIPVIVNVATPGVLAEDSPGASLAVATASVLGAAHSLIAFDVPATLAAAAVADAIDKVKAYEATVLPKDRPRETPSFGKRPLGRERRPPPDDSPATMPRDAGLTDPPPRDDRPSRGDGPPRRPFEPRGDRPPRRDDRPPRGDAPPRGDGPPRRDYPPRGDRPQRGDGPPRGDRPQRGDGPPRRDYAPRGDRPPRSDGPPRGDSPSRGDGPPRRDYAPRGDRPPRGDGPPRGDRPSRGDYPPRRDDRPPRGDGPPRGDRPPGGDRTFPPSRPPRRDFTRRSDQPPFGGKPPSRRDSGPTGGDRPPRKGGGPGKRFTPPKGPRGPKKTD